MHAAVTPDAVRSRILPTGERWRCLVRTAGARLWGTVTGTFELGTVVTNYEVWLDRGDVVRAWPGQVDAPPSEPGPLVVLQGGRS